MHTVVETVPYLADADRLFNTEEQATIVDIVSANPRCGVVMPGTGGVRKLRVPASGRGKRGGASDFPFRWRRCPGVPARWFRQE
jgi:hypothetical protein